MKRSYEITEPVAVLVAVNGQPGPDGDYMVPFGHPAYTGGAGETPLSQWQVDDLLARGYEMVG